ncbi:DUF2267 domain-containing protein [Microvirga massiliensis]|uniref:DUF2267 domain-containing protein n=1 Tax=Microvirga massiliensis TaxID=1033741 RepID=UPI0007C63684|nr:DUF2267 domain-containing protein [Microvirga massiliensis]
MSATGLDVFDETLQATHIWLDELTAELGPDRHVAWHMLGAVLRALRDRLPLELAAPLGSQLPLLIRGIYYDQWRTVGLPSRYRSLEEFLDSVLDHAGASWSVDPQDAAIAVFDVLARHLPEGQIRKLRDSLPAEIRALWSDPAQDVGDAGDIGPVTAHPEDIRNIRT